MMPTPVLSAYVARMPVIEAEREMRAIEAAAIGTGAASADDRSRRMSELQTLVTGDDEPLRPRTPAELVAAARGHGIGVRTVRR